MLDLEIDEAQASARRAVLRSLAKATLTAAALSAGARDGDGKRVSAARVEVALDQLIAKGKVCRTMRGDDEVYECV